MSARGLRHPRDWFSDLLVPAFLIGALGFLAYTAFHEDRERSAPRELLAQTLSDGAVHLMAKAPDGTTLWAVNPCACDDLRMAVYFSSGRDVRKITTAELMGRLATSMGK